MKKQILFLLCILSLSSLTAQSNFMTASLGSSGTSRFLYFPTNAFSSEESQELKKLEVIKPSAIGEIAYSFEKNEAIAYRIGIGFRHTRFGSKIYTIPTDGPIFTTPYGKEKQVVQQDQEFAFIEASFRRIKLLKSTALFAKVMLVQNRELYVIYQPYYTDANKKTMVGRRGSESYHFHRYDCNISMGLNYSLFEKPKSSLVIQPFVSTFLRPYRIPAGNYRYLYFDKDTVGVLWDFGVLVQYKFSQFRFRKRR